MAQPRLVLIKKQVKYCHTVINSSQQPLFTYIAQI